MGVPGMLERRKSKLPALQAMYFLEGGLLMVGNLLKTDSWIDDDMRTHCNVCVQQFLPFRRRHHCRTCGEVVCAGCSSQRTIRLTDVNVECATRICTFCVIRATDTSIKANEDAMQETLLNPRRLSAVSVLSLAPPPGSSWGEKQLTLLSAESELTSGSVVQLWPQPVPSNESARLQIARHTTIRSVETDPTMNLLVSIVGRTLDCPVAFIGIMDASMLWIKASVGLDDRITHIPRDGCICAHTLSQEETMIVNDTTTDKHFHAGEQAMGSFSMRFYAGTPVRVRGHCIGVVCALDPEPHPQTTDASKSTLEAVANIVSEVIEQRMDSFVAPEDDELASLPVGGSSTCTDLAYIRSRTNRANVDLHASLNDLNLLPPVSSSPEKTTNNGHLESLLPPQLPQGYANKITTAMDYFHLLQSGEWIKHYTGEADFNEDIATFTSYNHEYTRSSTEFLSTCHDAVARLLDYNDDLLYQGIFSQQSKHCTLGDQTWADALTLHPNFRTAAHSSVRVVTHWRQYPDGSNVVVAINDQLSTSVHDAGLLFGWFVAPCRLNGFQDLINVSCVIAQPPGDDHSQQPDQNLSSDLLRRLVQSISGPCNDTAASPLQRSLVCVPQGNERATNRDSTTANVSGSRRGHSSAERSNTPLGKEDALLMAQPATVAAAQEPPEPTLNENEQMLLDLLDRTISTQEILAEQQHEMAGVIDQHGSQLQQLSMALERVEKVLLQHEQKKKQKQKMTT